MDFSWFSARERRRRAAAKWFARMRGDEVERYRPRFERWHAAPDNAAAYARVAQSFDSAALLRLSQSPRAPSPASFQHRRPRMTWQALAASIALGLAIPSTFLLLRSGPFASTQAMLMMATDIGETRKVELADGSSITLDSDSALEYVSREGPGRVILHRGRARFETMGEGSFEVEANGVAAIATSGLFDVSLIGAGVSVTNLRGELLLGSGQSQIRLAPGSAARSIGGSLQPMAVVDPAWPAGMLQFNNEPLGEVVDRANRYSATKIRLVGDEVVSRRVTGAHRAGDQQGLARSLAKAFGLELVALSGGDLELRTRRK